MKSRFALSQPPRHPLVGDYHTAVLLLRVCASRTSRAAPEQRANNSKIFRNICNIHILPDARSKESGVIPSMTNALERAVTFCTPRVLVYLYEAPSPERRSRRPCGSTGAFSTYRKVVLRVAVMLPARTVRVLRTVLSCYDKERLRLCDSTPTKSHRTVKVF